MSYLFGDSFDCYAAPADAIAGYWDSGTVGFTLVAGRFSGSQAIQNAGTGAWLVKTGAGTTDPVHHICCGFQQTSAITGSTLSQYFQLSDGATNQVCIVFRSDGAILLTSATPGGTVLATYAGAVTASNTWYQFECEVVIHPSAGSFKVRKLGNVVDDHSTTGINTRPGANTQANKLTVGVNTASGMIVDDLLWRSDSVANGVPWVGDIRCQTRRPVSDASVQWTPSSPALPVQTIAFSANSASSNTVARFGSFTAPVSGLVGTVSVTPAVVWTGNVKCSLFASSASTPGAVLGSATPLSALPSGTPAVFTFGTPVAVTAGTQYFIGMIGDTGVAGVLPTGAGLTGFQHSSTTYAAFPIANPPGSGGIAMPVFTANISVTGAPNAAMVQDTVQDGATSYVYSSTVGQSDLYGISSIATTPASIVAVTTRAYLQKSDAGTRLAAVQLKSGGVTVQSPSTALNTVWGWIARTDTVDPNGGGPLTAIACNNMQVGVIVIGAPTTFNPSDKTAAGTLSGGNLTFTTGSNSGVRSVDNKSSGKWYWEYTLTTISGLQVMVGVANATASLGGIAGSPTDLCCMACNSGAIWLGNTTAPGNPNIGAAANGDVLCIALDANSNLIWLRRNGGNWNASGTASPGGTGGISTSGIASSGLYCVVASALGVSGAVITLNAGPTGFAQSVPSGFTAGFLA